MNHSPLTLVLLWSLVVKFRWLLTGVLMFTCAGALVAAFTLPHSYRSSVQLAPARTTDQGLGLGALGGGALNLLRGVQSEGSTETLEAISILKSRYFIERFIAKHSLLPSIFPQRWDLAKGAWRGEPPSLEDAYLRISRDVLRVRQDDETGFVTVSVERPSSEEAARWANQLVSDLNTEMRDRAVRDANADIAFLQAKMREAQQTELRASLADLTMERMRAAMLAVNRPNYAFRIVEPATTSKYRHSPNRIIILVSGVMIGLLACLAFLAFRVAVSRSLEA